MSQEKVRVYILGASGFLGKRCADYFRTHGYQVIDKRVDVRDIGALRLAFRETKPDLAINLTGPPAYPTIDWCEDNQEETVNMLVLGPINFAIAALEYEVYPVQITSGCIYTGGPDIEFTETDRPNFFGSFYSRKRILSQNLLSQLMVLQARIRMPLSCTYHPRNLLTKIASYKKVISIPNSITLVEDLWPAIMKLVSHGQTGIFNLTNDGYIEHKELLRAYNKFVDPDHNYELISLGQLEGPGGIIGTGRSNCILSTEKAKKWRAIMPALNEVRLEEVMKRYKQSVSQ